MNKLLLLFVYILAGACNVSSIANADYTFDFGDKQGTQGVTSLIYTKPELTITITRTSGVTFDIDSLAVFPFQNGSLSPFNGNNGVFVDDYFQVELSRPVAAIFIDAGDFGEDLDSLVLEGFLGSGLTGESAGWQGSLPGGGNSFGYATMQLTRNPNLPGFRSFRFRGGTPTAPNSVYYDNFNFRPSAVPEPSTIVLFPAVLMMLGAIRFYRRRIAAEGC